MTARDLTGVVVGAVVGATMRWLLGELLGGDGGLLVANIVGCAVIGWATTRSNPGPWLTAGWCGALTSFSALSLQLASQLDGGDPGRATLWLAVTLVGCAAGFSTGRHRRWAAPSRAT
jgi:fluoride ion exporter CrcB/FEX